MRYAIAMICMLLGFHTLALAARSVSPDSPIAIRLDPAQPTAVALPEPVSSVSGGVSQDRFSLDYDGPYVFLTALDPAVTGRLFVVGQSGKLYTLTFKVVSPADDVVHVTATPQQSIPRQGLSVSSVLRALRTGTVLHGQQEVELPPPTLPDARLTLTASTTMSINNFLGVVVTLRNTSTTPLALDVRMGMPSDRPADDTVTLTGWVWPPRLTVKAIAADGETLAPGESVHLYVVLEKRL